MIPDFIQIRDDKMTLRAYFRVSQKETGLKKNNLQEHSQEMIKIIETLPFGKIHKFIPKA